MLATLPYHIPDLAWPFRTQNNAHLSVKQRVFLLAQSKDMQVPFFSLAFIRENTALDKLIKSMVSNSNKNVAHVEKCPADGFLPSPHF